MRRALGSWAGVGLLLALLARVLRERLGALAFAMEAGWLFTGLAILVVAVWRARKPEGRRGHLLVIAAVVLGSLSYVPIARIGNAITVSRRFSSEREAYAQIVARVEASPSDGMHQDGDVRYVVDVGPPVRVAFMWPGGVVDNWCGAVYDPSGAVLEPVGDRRDLFGGELFFCEELEAPYYHCCFT